MHDNSPPSPDTPLSFPARHVAAYCDGSFKSEQRNAGWGLCIVDRTEPADRSIIRESGGVIPDARNSAAVEALAILETLKLLKREFPHLRTARVFSDALPLVRSIRNLTRTGLTSSPTLLAAGTLCRTLLEWNESRVPHLVFSWVKAHHRSTFHNRADAIATGMSSRNSRVRAQTRRSLTPLNRHPSST